MAEHEDTPSRQEAEVGAQIAAMKAELAATSKALELTQEFPTVVDKAITGLREFYDERFVWLEKLLDEQRRAEKEARDKAEQSMLQHMRSLEDSFCSKHETIRTIIAGTEKSVARLENEKSGANANWGWIMGVLGLVIAALAVGSRVQW